MVYDRIAKNYDRLLAPLEKRFLSNWRREALALLPENAVFLEIGAGTGLNFRFYPDGGRAVAGEISAGMLAFAREKITTENLSLVQTDARVLPFAADSFDAACAALVFCSLADPVPAFAELRRVVKNNGRIVLLEHVRPDGIPGFFFDLLNVLTVPLFEDHFNRRTARIAAESGLKILEVRKKAFGIVNLIICQVKK